eukprot:CAMPEP_0197653976 /NCGR_PEP_ID=MMETSP1338-20131121/38083_1 /TAXON_ID=43686 ORGANISM="Pelagodinium beii, Strain RCC1491" /NCGR_SAMPLE_ID=MMETSP1338 /ASSEMBLY_ACC=CAM_ASM_000754 /LENGTH=173 /DNA_ID=CAMNT_0043229315 /DNA_START=84 /DNA_END=602 /DNA_ORIENTATION=+
MTSIPSRSPGSGFGGYTGPCSPEFSSRDAEMVALRAELEQARKTIKRMNSDAGDTHARLLILKACIEQLSLIVSIPEDVKEDLWSLLNKVERREEAVERKEVDGPESGPESKENEARRTQRTQSMVEGMDAFTKVCMKYPRVAPRAKKKEETAGPECQPSDDLLELENDGGVW